MSEHIKITSSEIDAMGWKRIAALTTRGVILGFGQTTTEANEDIKRQFQFRVDCGYSENAIPDSVGKGLLKACKFTRGECEA